MIEVIIGANCLDAIEAILPIVFGREGEPCAKLTKLGWVLGGCGNAQRFPKVDTGRRVKSHVHFMQEVDPLFLEKEWEIESPGREQYLANTHSPKRMNPPVEEAVKEFQRGIKFEDNRYRVPLMWVDDKRPPPPDNYAEAKHIFLRQEQTMKEAPVFLSVGAGFDHV